MLKCFVFSLLLFQNTIWGLEITELRLLELAKKTPVPELQKIEANTYADSEAEARANDALKPSIIAGYTHKETKERAIVEFSPVFRNIDTYQVGLEKNFRYGFSSAVTASLDKRKGDSSGSLAYKYEDINTVIYNLNISMDLWKNLFGRMTNAQLENSELMSQNAKDKKELETHAFNVKLRKVYWELVANQEKQKISQNLYKLAEEQAADARKRFKNSVADKSEVARYESQVYARKGALLYLEYQRELLERQLRNLLPTLQSETLTLAPVVLSKSISEVMECSMMIAATPSAPLEYTKYDEISKRLKTIEINQKEYDDAEDDVDIKLTANFFKKGIGSERDGNSTLYEGSLSEAMDDMNDNNRNGFDAGIMINIPIGDSQKSAAEVRQIYHQKRFQAQRTELDTNLRTTHQQISRSMVLLGQIVEAKKEDSKKLNIRLNEMNKKYNQARISVSELIMDQDAKMNSDMAVVDTQLAVVNAVLDYFIIFNKTPCAFNRI